MKTKSFEKKSNRNLSKDTGASLLSNMRRIGGYIILSVVLVIGGIYMHSAFSKRNVYIDSFEVSDNLAKQGITGLRVANQILAKVAAIRETNIDRYKKEYLNLIIMNTNSEVEKATSSRVNYKISEIAHKKNTQFPDLETLIENINRLLRKSMRLGDIEISGTIILAEDVDKTLKLTISSTGQTPQIIYGNVDEIEKYGKGKGGKRGLF